MRHSSLNPKKRSNIQIDAICDMQVHISDGMLHLSHGRRQQIFGPKRQSPLCFLKKQNFFFFEATQRDRETRRAAGKRLAPQLQTGRTPISV